MIADACVDFFVGQQVSDLLERVADPLLCGQLSPLSFGPVPTFKGLFAFLVLLSILNRLFGHGHKLHIFTKLFFRVCFVLAPDLKVCKE